jgi:hypothetical protein
VLSDAAVLAAASIELQGGTLTGPGRIEGELHNIAGDVTPGRRGTVGTLAVMGNCIQEFDGSLRLEIAGDTSADLLDVQGTARLGGTRLVEMLRGYQPRSGQQFDVAHYTARQGTFARVDGLDLPSGLHLRAVYDEPQPHGPGSLRLKTDSQGLPPECSKPQHVLDWPSSKKVVAAILDYSDAAKVTFSSIQKHFIVVPSSLPSTHGDHGVTGRSTTDPTNRKLVAFKFAFDELESEFKLASILAHEMSHGRQVLEAGFTASEAAPFLTLDQFVTLKRSGEEAAFRLQGTVLTEIADASPDFERCRADFLSTDPRLQLLAAGRIDQMRDQIAEDYDTIELEQNWQRDSQVDPSELKALTDVKTKVETLLRTPEWQNLETIWKAHP